MILWCSGVSLVCSVVFFLVVCMSMICLLLLCWFFDIRFVCFSFCMSGESVLELSCIVCLSELMDCLLLIYSMVRIRYCGYVRF